MEKSKSKKVLSFALMMTLIVSMMIVAAPITSFAANTTYYVDSVGGNDANNGLSTGAAWKTIDKVNSITFQPGDKILFKAGCEWTGALKPKGSGTAASPITIDMYGTGAKPLFKPGADWQEPYRYKYNTFVTNEPTNNVITLRNVNYWEINNLELYDPKFDTIDPSTATVYRRGVFIVADDIGAMTHIYLKNLYIHGFRGPNSNDGKDSGGIIYHVNTNPTNAAARVRSWFNDMLVENCVIEKVGRSGINFLTPWTGRVASGGRWSSFPYPGLGQYAPHTNVKIRNNSFRDIDGDGTIIDNCSGAVFEYNTVARALSKSGYAAGVFPWNSDNTVIQFNDLYATQAGADAEGVEIDALNQNTMVQYNYSHDNKGGFIEFCTYDQWISYDGTYRYNISQNDWDGYGVINVSSKSYNSNVYNNTVFMGLGTRTFLKNQNVTEAGQVHLYNNIFYNAGTLNTIDWKTSLIDWSSNVYYNFPSTPSNDTGKLTTDPMFAQPGAGAIGINTVAGYKLKSGSPAINSGKTIANNGGRDYFGNTLYNGAPDRGAHEFSNDTPIITNIVANPGFESGSTPWLVWNSVVASTNQRTGAACGQVNKYGSWEQDIIVTPNTTYTLTAWLKVGTAGDDFRLGVKNYGGTETYVSSTSTTYTQKTITFTTGPSTTTARIYAYRPNSGTGVGYADDFEVIKN